MGVVTDCPPNFNGRRFEAKPMWRLLLDDGFRQALDYDERKIPWSHARRELAAILDKSPEVERQFMGNFSENVNLAEKLLNSRIKDILDMADGVIEALSRSNSNSAINEVRRIVDLLLPIVFDQAAINSVRAQTLDFVCVTVPLHAATRTLAEIIMAGVDRRTTRFVPLESGEHLPDGELRIAQSPEVGIQQDQKNRYLYAFHEHIIAKFTGTETQRRTPELTKKALIDIASKRLKTLSEKKRLTYYFIFHLPPDKSEARICIDTMTELKGHYPSIVFLNLNTDSEKYAQEADDLALLSYIVEKAPD